MKKQWISVLIVGLAFGTAWAIRGQFGHEEGASWAAAIGALALVLVARRKEWYSVILPITLSSVLGWGMGGMMSYGKIVGYGRSIEFGNACYGLLMLFVIGGLYGLLGGGLTGLSLWSSGRKRINWASLISEMVAGGIIFYYLLIAQMEILMTPPRSEAWAVCLGAGAAMLWHMVRNNLSTPLRIAFISALGGGFGFAFGNFLQITGNVLNIDFNMWNVMEYSIGFFGGSSMAYAVFTSEWSEEYSAPEKWQNLSAWAIVFGFVPVIVFINSRLYEFLISDDRLNNSFSDLTLAGSLISMVAVLALIATSLIRILRNKNGIKRKDVLFFFLLLLVIYIFLSYSVTGVFAGKFHLNHHLYVANLVIILLLLSRRFPVFYNEKGRIVDIKGIKWLLYLGIMVVITMILTLILINMHGEINGANSRFRVSERASERKEFTVKDVMDNKISWLYKNMNQNELLSLDYNKVFSLLTKEEKEILSTRHWMFDVNVPVVVSVMRSTEQQIVPFWITDKGFVKTGMTMKNEQTTYEVWQKSFKAGHVGLGINGFENYSLHYFVSVAPEKKSDNLVLTNLFPVNQYVGTLENGAFTYHDWDELVLADVPQQMKGEKLLTTVRGRGTESHLIGVFRTTSYPSTDKPDQVLLTWSSDPSTGIDIQWRTDTLVNDGLVKYHESGSNDIKTAVAEKFRMDDRVLMNDRIINRFTAKLRGLEPGKKYEYFIEPLNRFTSQQTFETAAVDSSFSFIWFGDTHHSPEFGRLIKAVDKAHPEAAFYSIAGDIVSDGLFRNQWDDIFKYTEGIVSNKPLMAVPGNHDNRSGLGAAMYRELFSYPENAPDGVEKEQTYAFTYKNALFLMIDATSPIDAQTGWIENQLAGSGARWKFAMFHFPPYSSDGGYPEIRKKWCSLFDKYHVDIVMSGHVHNYLRTKPMRGEEIVGSPSQGTIYLVSIGIPNNDKQLPLPYADSQSSGEMLYQEITIKGGRLEYSSMNLDGKVRDRMTIIK